MLKHLNGVLKIFSDDQLENVLPLKFVVLQKGRPKSTKRNKLGIEYENKKIKLEPKNENNKISKKRAAEDEEADVKIVGTSSLGAVKRSRYRDIITKIIFKRGFIVRHKR